MKASARIFGLMKPSSLLKAKKGNRFFAYLPTNAAHAPLNVDEKYTAPYRSLEGTSIPKAAFYGLISNVDENVGRLMAYLKMADLDKNTILIFATDNGTAFGYNEAGNLGNNQGYSGTKADMTEGGHRVPFYIKWPNSKLPIDKDIVVQSSHVDILPTLASLCNFEIDKSLDLDGVDLSPYLFEETENSIERTLYIHNRQDWRAPDAVKYSCLIRGKWRLIDGHKLYNIETDRSQKIDLAKKHPEVVKSLLKENEAFIAKAKMKKVYQEFPSEIIGSPKQEVTKLTIQNAIGDDKPIYAQYEVAEGFKNQNNRYAIEVEHKGKYKITCKRWPIEYDGKIRGLPYKGNYFPFDYQSISPEKVSISLFDEYHEKQIGDNDSEVSFEIDLEKGKTFMEASFIEGNSSYGVYYIYIEALT